MKFSTSDVGLPREVLHDALSVGMREIDRDRQLAAVARQVVRGLAGVATRRILQVRRTPGARVVAAAGPLDLDDGRAEVGEELRAPRSREHAGEVEDR